MAAIRKTRQNGIAGLNRQNVKALRSFDILVCGSLPLHVVRWFGLSFLRTLERGHSASKKELRWLPMALMMHEIPFRKTSIDFDRAG